MRCIRKLVFHNVVGSSRSSLWRVRLVDSPFHAQPATMFVPVTDAMLQAEQGGAPTAL